jgi:ribonuclease HI/ADP-ribose pyrophosphatase YjhB (NUDIX family)
MKQKLGVRAIIKQDGKILLGKRATGRESLRGLFELPGGRIEFGETAEVALERHLAAGFGLKAATTQLADVVTEIDKENDEIQHFVVLYLTSLTSVRSVTLGSEYSKYIWKKVSDLQLNEVTSMTAQALGLTGISEASWGRQEKSTTIEDKNTSESHYIVYADGGSRGNPGPSASGYVVMNQREEVLAEGGKYLGITTNNQAEYQAVLLGLRKAVELGAKTVEFRLDSMLVVSQMNGLFKIKNRDLWPIHVRIKEAAQMLQGVRFVHVKREFNTAADGVVNRILDDQAGR